MSEHAAIQYARALIREPEPLWPMIFQLYIHYPSSEIIRDILSDFWGDRVSADAAKLISRVPDSWLREEYFQRKFSDEKHSWKLEMIAGIDALMVNLGAKSRFRGRGVNPACDYHFKENGFWAIVRHDIQDNEVDLTFCVKNDEGKSKASKALQTIIRKHIKKLRKKCKYKPYIHFQKNDESPSSRTEYDEWRDLAYEG